MKFSRAQPWRARGPAFGSRDGSRRRGQRSEQLDLTPSQQDDQIIDAGYRSVAVSGQAMASEDRVMSGRPEEPAYPRTGAVHAPRPSENMESDVEHPWERIRIDIETIVGITHDHDDRVA